MDGLPLGVPGSLADFLREQAELQQQRRAQARKARRKSPRLASPAEGGRMALVDGLSFRIVCRPRRPTTQAARGDEFAAQAVAVAETFRGAFLSVWHRIPEVDRQGLLAYWRGRPDRLLRAGPASPRGAAPRIRIATGVSWSASDSACKRFGAALTFPLALIAERPEQLSPVIARALAEVHRYATRRHWGLILDRIEDPLARWERWRGKRADDASREAKLDLLEKAYLREYEADLVRIVREWGIEEPDAGTKR
jgi:hypothetical protein